MSEVLPLPTAPQTPTKLPSFKDMFILCRVVMALDGSTWLSFLRGCFSASFKFDFISLKARNSPNPVGLFALGFCSPVFRNCEILSFY